MSWKTPLSYAKLVIGNFLEDEAIVRGAGLAFFTVLSLAPLLTIMISIAGLMGHETQQRLIEQITEQTGPQVSGPLETIIENASEKQLAGKISAVLSIVVLFFSATAVFVQLQKSINIIWTVKAAPQSMIWGWLRKRLISLAMVLGIGAVIFVSIIVSTALSFLLPGFTQIADFLVNLLILVLLFALIYRFLPDVKIGLKNVFVAAITTALLFALGRYGLLIYFSRSTIGSAYGAAGSLLVMLLWIYYSALIFFLGAEITQIYSVAYGQEIEPADYAERTDNYEDQKKRIRETLGR